MMWLHLLLYIAHIETVILQGSTQNENRLILRSENDTTPCEGYIEIYHNNKRGYVGNDRWNEINAKVVCRSTHCGEPLMSTDVLRPDDGSPVWLNEVVCNGTEAHLWDCENPGWNLSFYQREFVKKIKCSDKINISLDGFKCAGAVQFSRNGAKSGYFCEDNWGKEQNDLLCESLNCGAFKESFELKYVERPKTMMKIKCSGIEDVKNLWQCVTQDLPCEKPAYIICTGHERLQLTAKDSNVCSGRLEKEENGEWNPVSKEDSTGNPDAWCQQMSCGTAVNHTDTKGNIQLKCTDQVKVFLSNGCYGKVLTEVNGKNYSVCGKNWDEKDAQVVCKQQNCGKLISAETKGGNSGIMDNVQCTGSESSLWHCKAKHHEKDFHCKNSAYVVCEGSVKVELKDGLGKCAGRVEIWYDGDWKRVAKNGWTDINSDVVCQNQQCGRKRNSSGPEKFSQGSGAFLSVNCDTTNTSISECIHKARGQGTENIVEAQGITCEEHKEIILKGNESCSGTVGIVKGDETYWLSGSSETWNQDSANTVCRQMHCVGATSFNSIPNPDKETDVWKESYSCSPNSTDLFDCQNTTLPSNHSTTIATVKCSGIIEVNLTNKCCGYVNICENGKCGHVCKDAWKDEKSEMLCGNLGCGNNIPLNLPTTDQRGEMTYKSLHTTKHSTNLNQCNLVKYGDEKGKCKEPVSVVCSGSVKSRFGNPIDKCSGNVEVGYGGQWFPVCEDALNDNQARNAICSELNCGGGANKKIDYIGFDQDGHRISQIQCKSNVESLKACNITTTKKSCKVVGLRCSSWNKFELINSEKACSGDVVVHSEGKISAVSIEGLSKTEENKLCKNLGCGNLMSHNTRHAPGLPITSFNCKGDGNTNIWDCKQQNGTSRKQLSIECEDEPNVTLSNYCHGEVRINGIQVCSTTWKDSYSHLVCKEQNCGNAIVTISDKDKAKPNGDYYHVSCERQGRLGQCKHFKRNCEGHLVSVYCVGNVRFNTTGQCGGDIEVNYRNKWEKVCPTSINSKFKEKLCANLSCDDHNTAIIETSKTQNNLETQLIFTEDHKDIKYSVRAVACTSPPAQIYCTRYVRPPIKQKDPPPSIVPIILGVGFVLILVILIVVFIRIYIVKKAKNAMNVSSRMLSRKEMEFESGDYEDVTNKSNEMEDFSQDRFRSETEGIMESDARSSTSFPYDDIDEASEARPLTSQPDTAAGGNYTSEGALDQSADGVTYEVDDPQENYDDIEASPEITETVADVHNNPQTTPESVAVAPPGVVQGGEEDYLVPGQDR